MQGLKKYGYCLLALVLLFLTPGCGKNEFTIKGQIKDAGSRTLLVVYTALSDKQDELVKMKVTCVDGAFFLRGATRHPSIVWILSPDGSMLHAVYVERGDKIEISGQYSSPQEWKIAGNKVSERYSRWMIDNTGLLTSYDAPKINDAVAKYVKENPKDVASALLLLTVYHRQADENGFHNLWKSLDMKKEEKERLLHLAMTSLNEEALRAATLPVGALTLHCNADSLVTLNPADSRATILYFWRRNDGPHSGTLRVLASQPEDVRTADIFLDSDSVQWRYKIQNDTIRPRNALWAFGGEMNLSLRRLNIPSDPYIIVADRKGKQIYRGTSPSEASAAAASAK